MKDSFAKLSMKATAALLALGGLALLCGCDEKKSQDSAMPLPQPIKIMTVAESSDSNFLEYPGKVRASQRVKLAFQVTGRIIEFPVKCGDHVKAGQILGQLDSRDFENAYKSAVATFEDAKKDFERHSKLLEKSIVSNEAFDAKKKAFEVAEAAMKTAAKALEDTTLKAPFDGIIAGTYVDNYQNIQAHVQVLSLQDISQVEIVVNIPEKDVIRANVELAQDNISKKFSAKVEFPALGENEFSVALKEFESEADSTTQTFKCVVSMPTPEGACVMPGMTALLKVRKKTVSSIAEGFWAPASAIMEGSDGSRFVWLVDGTMKASRRNVETGETKGDRILVRKGLCAGDRIATTGGHLLVEGAPVMELRSVDGRTLAKQTANAQ